ncbi:MAG: HzsA-related protein, partial [Planctomycetota bacterium]
PLLDFDRILFLKHHKSTFNHMCDQYYGHFARQGGGVFVLENPFGDKPTVKDLLAESPVVKGRLKGRKLDTGSFISLELDYDAKTVLFGYTEGAKAKWTPEGAFHVFKCKADGSGLTQLTDGPWNEFDPCVLPNGRIAFVSERCGGFLRCGRHCPTYILYGMMADGSDIIPISFHETHEWHPSVDNSGMLVYTRWDYVDRDSDIAHHLWHCFPGGRDPRSYHGNYPKRRESRPWMEMAIRAIPDSSRYICVAAAHHGQNYGSLLMIDLGQEDDRSMSQLKRITPEVHMPESESAPGISEVSKKGIASAEVYATPWPLSEDYYLCVYDNGASNHGVYLVDSFGNRELLYRDPAIPCLDPIPFRPRKRPPIIPTRTWQAKVDRTGDEDLSMGTVTVMNVYESVFPWPEGTRIKELRIINIFPKATPPADVPNIGHAAQSLARGVLGTVPVEEDGSAHFKMPAGVSVYFQAIDENGLCVQNMRSATFVHPGETLSCVGCHEPKNARPNYEGRKMPLALKRDPSVIKPEAEGSYPLTFPRLVQPVLDAKCLGCHEENRSKKAPSLRGDRFGTHGWSQAFHTLQKYAWGKSGGNGALHSRNGNKSYSVPGQDGARVSKLYKHLTQEGGHHDLKLTAEEMRRITLWLDCNSNFYGAYFEIEKQARGGLVKPRLGTPPWIEFDKMIR